MIFHSEDLFQHCFYLLQCFLFTSLGQGLYVSSRCKDQFVASQVAISFAYLPAVMLSGFLFEISSMPKIIQAITYLIPARYFVSNLQTLFLAGDIWSLLIKNIFFMFLIGSVFFILTLRRTKKRVDI